MTSLFAVATLISSCTKDVEPEADNAAATIVTRAAGDTPAPTAYIEVNDTNPLNVLMYRNARTPRSSRSRRYSRPISMTTAVNPAFT